MQCTRNKTMEFFLINHKLRNVFTFRVVVFFAHVALCHHAVSFRKWPRVSKVGHPTNAIDGYWDFLLWSPIWPNPQSYCWKRNYFSGRNTIDKMRAKFRNVKSQFRWIQRMHQRCRKCDCVQSAAPILFLLFAVHQANVENFFFSVLESSNAINYVLIRFTAVPVAIENQHMVWSKTFTCRNIMIPILMYDLDPFVGFSRVELQHWSPLAIKKPSNFWELLPDQFRICVYNFRWKPAIWLADFLNLVGFQCFPTPLIHDHRLLE